MPRIKGFNKYKIIGDVTVIYLKRNNGEIFETLIDTEDLDKVKALNLHWHTRYAPNTGTYYVMATKRYTDNNEKRKGKSIYLHIEIMNPEHDKTIYIDHENHDTLDNRKFNLRKSLNHENLKHRNGKNVNNNSGYRNVSWIKGEEVWRVQLQVNGINTKIKDFPKDKLEEAGKYAEEMRFKYYGEFAGNY
jgi:hypothetical protein